MAPGIQTDGLWERVRARPAYAPELLALAAVERLGPEADRYSRWVRSTYPAATDDRLAQAAGRRFATQARGTVLASLVGWGLGEVAALGWLQARLVLHVAAAYRKDPGDPERAAELLALLRVHPSVETARAALAAAGDDGDPPGRSAGRVFALGAGGQGARRLAGRLLPGAGLLVGVLLNGSATESLARRAISFYRTTG
jgi:hypothetical protein